MKNKIFNIITLFSLVIFLNIITEYTNIQIDLTKDNLYSISKETKDILNELDDRIFIKVYLEGDFPAEFKYLQKSTYDFLKRLKEIQPSLIDFEFINPNENSNEQTKLDLFKQLVSQGLAPTDIEIRKLESSTNQIIFPGAIMYYKDKSIAVNFLKNQIFSNSPSENVKSSIENIEFEFMSAILHLTRNSLDNIAFLEGNGQLLEEEVFDITESVLGDNLRLSYYFNVNRFNLKELPIDTNTLEINIAKQIERMKKYQAIIIAKPTIPFNNIDKFLIDQYIMNGGKVLWLIDGVNASMDSLLKQTSFVTNKNELNLDDQLFKYGVRINADLVEDLRCTQIPIVTGYSNNIPQQRFFPWPYFPLVLSNSSHSISKGLDGIKCEFVSSIDLINNSIKKTVLLSTSSESRLLPAPAKVSLGILENPPDLKSFNKPNQNIAVLLEGEFESVFKNRILPKNQKIKFKEDSKENKMIIVSDGDLIANKVSDKGIKFPLAYDKYIEYVYPGNKYFLLNAIQYLCNNRDITSLKTKSIKLRMLDKKKISTYRPIIQFINIILPLLFLILFSIFYYFQQKKKYA